MHILMFLFKIWFLLSCYSSSNPQGLSTVSGVSYKEEHPGSLEQSQSFTDIPTMHAKAESKKRRAPVPPAVPVPSQGNASFKSNQVKR